MDNKIEIEMIKENMKAAADLMKLGVEGTMEALIKLDENNKTIEKLINEFTLN